ncbi:MAG: hypothetical protein GX567_09275 [Clostridia bacterium]|nr:hypothetical protein [Clostridia bacterium]
MNNTKEKNNLGDIMQQVIVFGTGKHWENHRRLLRLDYEVIGFMDNNKSKQGMQYQGKNIYAPEQLFEVNFDKLIVASTAKDVILRQLIDLGISTEKIEILNCCRLVDSKKYSSTINFDGSVDYHIENIFFRCNTRSDHNVVQEIFDDGNYNYTNQKDQFIVIDVGMNIGIAHSILHREKT